MTKEAEIINYNNKSEYAKQVQHDYKVSHYAYIIRDRNHRKLELEKLLLFRITQVHTNGYVRIQIVIANEKNEV